MQLFKTQRLIARHLSIQDLPVLTEILSDPEVMRHSVRGVYDEDATRKFIDWCISCYSSHEIGPWAILEQTTGDLIGFCGVGPELVGGITEINLGYRFAKKFWNQGFATEAVVGAMQYAFEKKHCESIVVIIEPEHVASIRVTEKAGFRNYTIGTFHNRQVRLYRLTHQDWSFNKR